MNWKDILRVLIYDKDKNKNKNKNKDKDKDKDKVKVKVKVKVKPLFQEQNFLGFQESVCLLGA